MNRKAKQWEDKLNANKAGIQNNAEDFTNQFMQDMYSQSSMTNIETREATMKQEEKQVLIGNCNRTYIYLKETCINICIELKLKSLFDNFVFDRYTSRSS